MLERRFESGRASGRESDGSNVDRAVSTYRAFISYSHAVDGKLAPALQNGLQQFAKRWNKLRAIRIFRDQTSLSANPGLWSSIERALAESDFFILLASPEAARSEWVAREVGYWLEHRNLSRLLVAVTDGDLVWDGVTGLDWERTTALPPVLRGHFREEPRYVDLRWARTAEHVSLQDPRFREAVADLAAPLHGRHKDDLLGDDVRQHRRTKRLARSAIALLTILAVTATTLAAVAWVARGRAQDEARTAQSRQLAADATATRPTSLDQSLLLSLEAVRLKPTAQAQAALFAGLQHDPRLVRYLRAFGWSLFTPDGTVLVGGTDDGLSLWDMRDAPDLGPPVRLATGRVRSMAISPDGRTLAVGTDGRKIFLVDVGVPRIDGEPLVYEGTAEIDWVSSVAFSPDGRTLASGGSDGLVLWDVASRQQVSGLLTYRTPGGVDGIDAVVFTSDGREIVADASHGVVLLDVASREWVGGTLPSTAGTVDLALSPDGRMLATVDNMGATLWHLERREPVGPRLLAERLSVNAGAFSPDGKRLALAGSPGIELWDVETQQRLEVLKTSDDGNAAVAFSPDGRYLLAAGSDGLVLWELGRPGRLEHWIATNAREIWNVAYSPDGATVALGTKEGLMLWDRQRGERRGQYMQASLIPVGNVDFSPDGELLASVGDDGVSLWSVREQRRLGELIGGTIEADGLHKPWKVAFSVDGRTLVLAAGGRVYRRDLQSRAPVGTPIPYSTTESVGDLAISPDGSKLAVSGADGVLLWDMRPNAPVGARRDAGKTVTAMAFSPDSGRLAVAVNEGVQLRDTRHQRNIGQPIVIPGDIDSLAFSPDGRRLAAGTPDGLTLWDLAAQRRIGEVTVASDRKPSGRAFTAVVDFRPDGKELALAASSRGALLLDLDLKSWRRIACEVASRTLTRAEWFSHLGGSSEYKPSCAQPAASPAPWNPGGPLPFPREGLPIPAGHYVTGAFRPPLVFEVDDGWRSGVDNEDFLTLVPDGSSHATAVTLGRVDEVFDPGGRYSEASELDDARPAPADIAGWLASHPRLRVDSTGRQLIGSFAATRVDVTVVDAYPHDGCQVEGSEERCVVLFSSSPQYFVSWQGSRVGFYFFDSAGYRLFMAIEAPAHEFEGFAARAERVLATLRTPR